MVKEPLVIELIEDGAKLVLALREQGVNVVDAYWAYTSEDDFWRLHLIVPDLTHRGIRQTYGQVIDAAGDHERDLFTVNPLEVKVVDLNNPTAAVVHSYNDRHGNLATTFRDTMLERQHVENMYIYRRDMRLK